ncbi:radical SAM protein [Paenibacillus sp. J2TS4]|uniref:SPL family radical SAM protein n=1 Tax=Paenibacillus sp. J2TS4 TaxID=2807194 RepID=UPI001B1F3018|nr:radical SAM protein [Paenibacillus sp. J2TS4]GIP34980.1 radical SAM protein [Paenibacillus sp. J2TS4]
MKKDIEYKKSARLLNPGSGFLQGYSHTLNPYGGCTFACTYCYVRRMPVGLFRGKEWGNWVDVKTGAREQLLKELRSARRKGPVTIFMSSSTDPYQPVEYKEQVTRSLLEAMIEEPPDFLFVQTRSPLVTRDKDLFLLLQDRIRVSVTVETDLEEVRKAFAPYAPPIPARLKALQELTEAGIPTQAAVAPVLPSGDDFAARLSRVTNRVCVDDYFMGDGSGGKRTEQLGMRSLYKRLGLEEWYRPDAYQRVIEGMSREFPPDRLLISREGFSP